MKHTLDELSRLNNAGDRYGHITPGVVAELIAEMRRLREAMKLQANAARMGMDAAKTGGAIMLELAEQARAESSPDALASERAMNAMLTEENEALREDAERYRKLAELVAFGEWFVGTDDEKGPRDRMGPTQQRYLDDKADMDREMDAARKEPK